jgi:cation transport regulator ChaC
MSGETWVFGYGSLVAPSSVARTVGRLIDHPTERVITHLHGYGRRWNYGSLRLRGHWHHAGRSVRDGVVVSLGLTAADETCNGVSFRVTGAELAALGVRESDYEMTDITDQVSVEGDAPGRVVTFVPRRSSIERYEEARDAGRAAIRAEYVSLVAEAFDDLGGDHRARYDQTPGPDVPIAEIDLVRPRGS